MAKVEPAHQKWAQWEKTDFSLSKTMFGDRKS